ncbi:MAG: hypothetical protein HZB33_02985 [Nitrospirae bacterium]|nr:hypothetical protein [Nitrospirota bacterium]
MGPITLSDKSFLQSLTVDESVWFDHFYLSNVCPLFFVETLGDLTKKVREGRTPEREVQIIASKFPEMHGSPNIFHMELCLAELMGDTISMDGRIYLAAGRPVKHDGQTGVNFDRSPEAAAFQRWQEGKFMDIERESAAAWRIAVNALDLAKIAQLFRQIGVDGKHCKTLGEVSAMAKTVAREKDRPFDRMNLALTFLNIPERYHSTILQRWSIMGYPPLIQYAPYVSYALTVEVFFQIAISVGLISPERPNNRVDIGYLFYLPFCHVFVSSDKLHQRCAPYFLRDDQDFIWGGDLKKDLQLLNLHYSSLTEGMKEKGIMSLDSFASGPPSDGAFLTTRLWDRHLPLWRSVMDDKPRRPSGDSTKLTEHLKAAANAPTLSPREVDFDVHNPDFLNVERRISKKKGAWWQLPKDLKDPG